MPSNYLRVRYLLVTEDLQPVGTSIHVEVPADAAVSDLKKVVQQENLPVLHNVQYASLEVWRCVDKHIFHCGDREVGVRVREAFSTKDIKRLDAYRDVKDFAGDALVVRISAVGPTFDSHQQINPATTIDRYSDTFVIASEAGTFTMHDRALNDVYEVTSTEPLAKIFASAFEKQLGNQRKLAKTAYASLEEIYEAYRRLGGRPFRDFYDAVGDLDRMENITEETHMLFVLADKNMDNYSILKQEEATVLYFFLMARW
ncbi:uncharacterized protein B0H18DRAFT_54335 [Fomitopsis serialis]|uniref:uncharacterized protein n=1 Tax=Fomitopsis serialis TaxID=139415 RepID=UPI002007C441|nr:uncharacterized protein B0H18DRAFT_54335 [Neoantrodia serialis]KAH9932358.1 hypothetical protein B0H18DRAFT_54335 [Neoantrodia serialis]